MKIDDDVTDIVFGGELNNVPYEIGCVHAKQIQKLIDKYKQNIEIRANTEKTDKERIRKLQLALNKIAWISKHPVEG